MVKSETVRLEKQDQVIAKLIESGVNERWLVEVAKPSREEARQLLKGILYLKEMYGEKFKDE